MGSSKFIVSSPPILYTSVLTLKQSGIYIDDHHFEKMRILCKLYYEMSIWKSYPRLSSRCTTASSRGASIRHEHGFHLANHKNNIRRYVQTAVSTDRQTRTIPASSLRVQEMGLARELAPVLVQGEGSQCSSTPRRGRVASQGRAASGAGTAPGC